MGYLCYNSSRRQVRAYKHVIFFKHLFSYYNYLFNKIWLRLLSVQVWKLACTKFDDPNDTIHDLDQLNIFIMDNSSNSTFSTNSLNISFTHIWQKWWFLWWIYSKWPNKSFYSLFSSPERKISVPNRYEYSPDICNWSYDFLDTLNSIFVSTTYQHVASHDYWKKEMEKKRLISNLCEAFVI